KRVRRYFRLAKLIFLRFRTFFVITVTAFWISTLTLYFVYPLDELPRHHHSLLGTAYDTMLLTFFEQPIPFVDDWRLVPVFFGLPILGLLVIIDGVVRFGSLIIQYHRYSPEWQVMQASTYENHIIVCGMGNVGQRVVDYLLRFGEEIVCIEKNDSNPFLVELAERRIPVVCGDATLTPILEQASITRAKALLAITDNDLANLETALSARDLCPTIRVVMRMFDQRLANKIERSFGVDCVFSASALSAPVFAQAALSENILSSFEFGGTVINAFQLIIDSTSSFINIRIDDVRRDYEVTVLMHERDGHVDWNPAPDILLKADDKLLIMADREHIKGLLDAERGNSQRTGAHCKLDLKKRC
ncbi:MAG: TrkA family potassium uptake protein, partial [Cyanobacteria bacterium]|nr:TrkA family potassium uptake protein [Cyanobacteriota bacterium]